MRWPGRHGVSRHPAVPARRVVAGLAVFGLLVAAGVVACTSSGRTSRRTFKSRSCADCHQPFMQGLESRQPHFKEFATRCEDCHDRHGLIGVLKLKTEEPELCVKCHEEAKGFLEGGHAHVVGEEAKCSACHDPHGGEKGSALLKATGKALCFSCHDQDRYQGAVQHEPAAADCSTCHDPHGGSGEEGLTAPVPELCTGCHDAGTAVFIKKHAGYDVAASDCGSCHDPHAGKDSSLLRASVHEPLADGDCEVCHVSPEEAGAGRTQPGAAGPATLMAAAELCSTCHSDEVEEYQGRSSPHEPAVEGECLECHTPHASRNARLLTAPADGPLCAQCHENGEEIAAFDDVGHSPHPPAAQGKCLECHDPHGGVEEPVLRQTQPELCLKCHDSMTAELDRESVHAPLEDCTSCHAAHGSNDRPILKKPITRLCFECHEDLAERFKREKLHVPFGRGDCLACHKAHAAQNSGLLVASPQELCFGCHERLAEPSTGGSIHSPVAKGDCLDCHRPHADPDPGLLVAKDGELCSRCHGLTQKAIDGAAVVHAPVQAGTCLACHQPHVSAEEKLLAQTDPELCRNCHAELFAELEGPGRTVHDAVEDAGCLGCHEAHQSDNLGLTQFTSPELCLQCHDLEDEALSRAHLGLLTEQSDCLGCHAPHSAPGEGLFWPNQHPPFSEKECNECHTDKKD